MSAFITLSLLFALHDPLAPGDPSVCRCAILKATDGWCPKCRVGYYAGQRVESAKLFEVLDLRGHEVDAEKTRCAACRNAIHDGGYCEACHMGYINGRGYFSRVCYHLAKGRTASPASSRKSCCPPLDGWCATCKQGVVGNRIFDDDRDFAAAQRYYEVLIASAREAARCEDCAMAMITDSRCHLCRIEYKDGKPIGTPAEANHGSATRWTTPRSKLPQNRLAITRIWGIWPIHAPSNPLEVVVRILLQSTRARKRLCAASVGLNRHETGRAFPTGKGIIAWLVQCSS